MYGNMCGIFEDVTEDLFSCINLFNHPLILIYLCQMGVIIMITVSLHVRVKARTQSYSVSKIKPFGTSLVAWIVEL